MQHSEPSSLLDTSTYLSRSHPRRWFTTYSLINLNLNGRLLVIDQSMLVYSFSCCCTTEYVGRTTRRLSSSINGHVPGVIKSFKGAIVEHLANTNHKVDPTAAFRDVYRISNNLSKLIRQKISPFVESISLRLPNPILCQMTNYVQGPKSQRRVTITANVTL